MVLIKYSGKHVKMYFNMKITFVSIFIHETVLTKENAYITRTYPLSSTSADAHKETE